MARIKLPKKQDYHTLRRWLQEYKHLSIEELSRLSGISVAKLREWMVYCDVVSLSNGDLLKVWVEYKNYSTAEACILLGVSRDSFNEALNRNKIDKYRVKARPKKEEPSIVLPRTKEGFQELHNKYGVAKIARMAGLSKKTVKKIKYRHDVVSPRRDKHLPKDSECNCLEWLVEHYVKKKLSLKKCSKLAGVAPNTIRSWLINHGIVPRPRRGKNATLQAGIP